MLRKFFNAVRSFLRTNFLAGFFLAIPFAITIGALLWVWSKIHGPLKQIFELAVGHEDLPWSDIGSAIDDNNFGMMIVPLISLAIVLMAVLLLGIVARSIIGRIILLSIENFFTHLPVVGMLYSSLKQLGEAFHTEDGSSKFQKAVAVQFPYKGVWALGFVTGNAASIQAHMVGWEPDKRKILTVFVPTTPLPTQGFMLMIPEEETHELSLSVQDALKLVVSGGMIGAGESLRHQGISVSQLAEKNLAVKLDEINRSKSL